LNKSAGKSNPLKMKTEISLRYPLLKKLNPKGKNTIPTETKNAEYVDLFKEETNKAINPAVKQPDNLTNEETIKN
jgi:hypothetical protein